MRSDGKSAVDDCSITEHDISGNPGTQSSRFGDTTVHFFFDGRKCYYLLSPITEEEINTLPKIIITPEKAISPTIRTHTRPLTKGQSQIVWDKTLAFAPQDVIDKTLAATTQLVPNLETEMRAIMHDHLKSRLPHLKMKRVNDTL